MCGCASSTATSSSARRPRRPAANPGRAPAAAAPREAGPAGRVPLRRRGFGRACSGGFGNGRVPVPRPHRYPAPGLPNESIRRIAMKRHFAVLISVIAAGCAATGVDQAESAAQSMRSLKTALEDAPAKIEAVSTSLQTVAKEGTDMKAAFATFSSDVDALGSHREHVRSLRKDVESNKDTFTNAWQQRLASIKDADLRKRAEERRDAVLAKFGELAKNADSSKAEFDPWFDSVVDLRGYLENDLNQSGVASVKAKIKDVTKHAA